MATQNIFDLTDTWNAGATTFTAIKMNVTDTASAAGSLLLDLQVGGSSQFSISKTGGLTGLSNVIEVRNGVNAQTFRVYNTFTDASNYERGFVRWNTNSFEIGTEKLGTGSARNLFLTTDGTARWQVGNSTGHLFAVADNTYDIGASGANRPRNLFLAGGITTGAAVTVSGGSVIVEQTRAFQTAGWGRMLHTADGVLLLNNNASTDFGRLQFGGTTNAFGAIGRDGAGVKFVGGDGTSVSWVKVPGVTVANLPSAATAGAGARSFVTDALAPIFGSAVTGGGAVPVPVYSTGAAWNVG